MFIAKCRHALSENRISKNSVGLLKYLILVVKQQVYLWVSSNHTLAIDFLPCLVKHITLKTCIFSQSNLSQNVFRGNYPVKAVIPFDDETAPLQ